MKDKQVNGFTNGEEEEMDLSDVVPFFVEDALLRLSAIDNSRTRAESAAQR